MKEYSIVEQFALIALDGQDSQHSTLAKKVTVYGIEAANILTKLFAEGIEQNIPEFKKQISGQLTKMKKLSPKKLKRIEKNMADILIGQGALTEIPNLLGCDINYYTAKVTMREYKCDEQLYRSITEGIKAVILEPGEVPLETICLLWLCRECGCMHAIFSIQEQKQLEERIIGLMAQYPLYQIIWQQEFHKGLLMGLLGFLHFKSKLFKNPYLEGVNLLFPFLERRQAVFIDMVIIGTTVGERRQATIDFLIKQGHTCEEIQLDSETIVKIDNGYYKIWPSTKTTYKIPIQGITLLPVYK